MDLSGIHHAHKLDVFTLKSRIKRLEDELIARNIPLPTPPIDRSGEAHYEKCREIVNIAYDLLERMEELRQIIGSGVELLQTEAWR